LIFIIFRFKKIFTLLKVWVNIMRRPGPGATDVTEYDKDFTFRIYCLKSGKNHRAAAALVKEETLKRRSRSDAGSPEALDACGAAERSVKPPGRGWKERFSSAPGKRNFSEPETALRPD
jgi:hypothetical protein